MTAVASLRDELLELEAAARPLEPGPGGRARLREEVVGCAERFLESLGDRRAFEEESSPGDGPAGWPISEAAQPLPALIEILEREVLAPGGQPASGRHLAYLTGGGLYHAALADYLAAVANKFGGLFFTGPGLVRMERLLVRWVADLVGYPAGAGGAILSGGSLANLTAITAARGAHRIRAADVPSTVVYITTQTHHSVGKALRIAGLGEAPVRRVALDERHRLRPDALAAAIREDRARGLRPWLIVATAGSTDSGAVDPIDALASIARREGCWLHVDAAYGGFFLLTEDGRRAMRGIEHSDSAVLDPHKSLFLPWGAGIVVARDAGALREAFDLTGDYLQDALAAEGPSPADLSPELTKPFRALRMWLPLTLLGTAPFRAALDEKLLLARYFRREVGELGFRVGPEPDLSVVTFRRAPAGVAPERADELNRAILDGVRRDGRVFLSSTRLDGRFTLRMAALAHRTHLRDVDLALQVLREQAASAP